MLIVVEDEGIVGEKRDDGERANERINYEEDG